MERGKDRGREREGKEGRKEGLFSEERVWKSFVGFSKRGELSSCLLGTPVVPVKI